MSEVKHTPGPWQAGHLIDDASSCTCGYIFGNDDRMGAVGEVYVATDLELHGHEYPPPDEAKANLRLIVAAPDLLAALTDLVRIRDWCAQAGGAKGPLPQDVIHQFALMQIPAIDAARAAIAKAEGRS